MHDKEKMLRVSKSNPCPICKKSDWCLYAEDGSAAICQRIEQGSVKECRSKKDGDTVGYLHILIDRPKNQHCRPQRSFTVRQDNKPVKDFTALQQQYSRQITRKQLDDLSQQLGVSRQSLKRLFVGWDGKAYTFPMSNEKQKIIGIRRRFPDGDKVTTKGSKTGLFIPAGLSTERLLIAEGPTDAAAALDLGFDTIGRPNCNSKVNMTARFAKGRHVVIVADNDPPKEDGRQPGKDGAEKLARELLLHCLSVKIIYPPNKIKDLRQWLRTGLTRGHLQHVIDNMKPLTLELI